MIAVRSFLRLAIAACSLLTACRAPQAAHPRPVIVQGAMDVEIRKLAGAIEHPREENILAWTFWSGTVDGYRVVGSKPMKGVENTAPPPVLPPPHYTPPPTVNPATLVTIHP